MKYLIILSVLICTLKISYSGRDTLYFCEVYKGAEIGNNSQFMIGKSGKELTVMLRTQKPINTLHVLVIVIKLSEK